MVAQYIVSYCGVYVPVLLLYTSYIPTKGNTLLYTTWRRNMVITGEPVVVEIPDETTK